MMLELVLYSTDSCHLCELAKDLIMEHACGLPVQVVEQDIAFDSELVFLYGNKIPVLKSEHSESELCWPFDEPRLLGWLEKELNQ